MIAHAAVEARVRPKNQITIPSRVADALQIGPNDTLAFEVDQNEPGVVRVRRVEKTFAGALTGVYGTTDEFLEWLDAEHASWDRD